MSHQSDYISLVRDSARQVWEGINSLVALQREWNALDYGATLATPSEGANAGLTKEEVGAVVFATADALATTLNAGIATNLAKLL